MRTSIGLLAVCWSVTSLAQASCYSTLKAQMPQAGTVIFGELHGTTEIPKFFSQCVREFVSNGEEVRVFLEFPASQSATAGRYLRKEADEPVLLSAPHWKTEDGRASQAMLALYRDLRGLPAPGVTLSGIDADAGEADREQAMARNFLAAYSPKAYNLVLVGNLHAQLGKSRFSSIGGAPFGQRIQERLGKVISLDARYQAGTAWICTGYCGKMDLSGNQPTGGALGIAMSGEDPAFSGVFSVGKVTASPPAR